MSEENTMIILSLNCGSSSVKYRLYDYTKNTTLATGIVERVGISKSYIKQTVLDREPVRISCECGNHGDAIKLIIDTLLHFEHGILDGPKSISAVGHRLVHGGEQFTKSVLITPATIETFRSLYELAPLHNRPTVLGIEAALNILPDIPHVVIVDTAWHHTMPPHAYIYALPYEWYEKHRVRRYGFHGTSFLYVAKRAALLLGKDPFQTNLIILHIGNGVSANAVKNGVSYDTSMGFTPLEGLVMGTRSGDHDAAIDLMIMEREGIPPDQMNDMLNKKSGLLGITGRYTDRRDIEQAAGAGDAQAKLAIEIEAYRIKKYIGAYSAAIGGADAIVFTAGAGEMSSLIREKSVEELEFMGVKLDKTKNNLAKTHNAEIEISAADSKVKIFVIPTDEERVNIEDAIAILNGRYDEHMRFTYDFQSPAYVNLQREREFKAECEKKPGLREIQVKPKR
jgi:acetate kinase